MQQVIFRYLNYWKKEGNCTRSIQKKKILFLPDSFDTKIAFITRHVYVCRMRRNPFGSIYNSSSYYNLVLWQIRAEIELRSLFLSSLDTIRTLNPSTQPPQRKPHMLKCQRAVDLHRCMPNLLICFASGTRVQRSIQFQLEIYLVQPKFVKVISHFLFIHYSVFRDFRAH